MPQIMDNFKFSGASTVGRGGMEAKVASAWDAAQAGVTTVIANGKEPNVLLRVRISSLPCSFLLLRVQSSLGWQPPPHAKPPRSEFHPCARPPQTSHIAWCEMVPRISVPLLHNRHPHASCRAVV